MVRIGLFLSSFSILFATLAIRFERPELSLGSALLAILGVLALVWILRVERSKGPASYTISESSDESPQTISYIAAYLLPFVTLAEPPLRDVVGYVVFLLVAAVVYAHSEMVRINPLLYLARRRVYRITTDSGWQAYLVSATAPSRGTRVLATRLASDVLVEASPR